MPPKTTRKSLANTLEDLPKKDFDKFCRDLVDRKEEPRVRRNRVEEKNFLDVAEVLVSTFTERGAVRVAAEILREIGCSEEAARLVEETSGESSKPASSSQTGASGAKAMADSGCTGEQFVEIHQLELINRVSNIESILDELLYKKVISPETYDTISALKTNQAKMRALYTGCLRASGSCKRILYEILEEKEPYLVADLKGEK
ncbi:apoptosis-associated speck-like protein containing a CARD [Pempheris klunzingeri]|uniref:apoptosis-associated speck-like protein containing a CARD n=1 Tax=Pempheris klunzingeri TaxID=3127111 RepID=UPI00397FBC60